MAATMDLTGKVALVTGSSRGIGYGIALALAAAGANLVVASRHQNECERVASIIDGTGVKTLPAAVDVNDRASFEVLVQKVISHFGSLDILVNNAGTALTRKAAEITEEDWDLVLNTNLKSVFFCAQVVGWHMRKRKKGKIINIASVFGLVGERQILPYCAAKGGVIQMTKALALEWAKYGIQVNALCPGYIRTAMNARALEDERTYKHIIGKIPARRLGLPEDLAGAAVFLASEASDYMTGQVLVMDGGWTAE